MKRLILRMIAHPLTKGLDIDDPQTTVVRRQVIQSKPFLKKLYEEWYDNISAYFPSDDRVLELGSGAGFLKKTMPWIITSELFPCAGAEVIIDARAIAMPEASLDGIVMINVLHHIPDCNSFFSEATRVIRPGGGIIMIEPWNTPWSRWVYKYLHHESFEPDVREWRIPLSGPLSGANGALPWIIFQRDRVLFEDMHPQWGIESIVPTMPVAYLLSGGVSLKNILPGWMYRTIRFLEKCSNETSWSMFAMVTLKRAV